MVRGAMGSWELTGGSYWLIQGVRSVSRDRGKVGKLGNRIDSMETYRKLGAFT